MEQRTTTGKTRRVNFRIILHPVNWFQGLEKLDLVPNPR
jgi:hypothetical protein